MIMRKSIKIVLFGIGLSISNNTYAQSLVNGEFNNPNPFMSQYIPSTLSSCYTFDNGYLPNWYRSHGTPDLAGSPLEYMEVKSVKDAVDISEGVVGGYNFQAGITYTISIDVTTYCDCPPGGYSNTLNVYAANNIAEGSIGTDCLAPVPSVSDKQLIDSRTLSSYSNYTFSFTPSANYQQIWIYTSNPATPGVYSYAISNKIDYIRITSCTNYQTKEWYYGGYIPYDNEGGNTRNPGPYFLFSNAANNANHNTTLISTYIEAYNNTSITVDDKSYFLALAVTDCAIVEDYPGPAGKPESGSHFDQFASNQLSIFPNPSSGNINLALGIKSDYDVKLINTMGSVVYASKIIQGNSLAIPELGLPNGTYTIYVIDANANEHYVKKLSIVR